MAFLDWLEEFLGDVGKPNKALTANVFGLRAPTPLWTAPAFDRCLLIASVYPVATLFIVWVVSGHVGPAEAALVLPPATAGWKRALAMLVVLTVIVLIVVQWRFRGEFGFVRFNKTDLIIWFFSGSIGVMAGSFPLQLIQAHHKKPYSI